MRSAASRLHKGFSFAKRFQGCSDWICCDGAAWAGRWDAWAPGGTVRGKAFSHVVLDLGCGWGPIALTLAFESPEANVWAVDVNERAVDLTHANAQANGHTNIHTAQVDESSTPLPAENQPAFCETVPSDLTFDVIWSNPPIRVGKEALHTLLMAWLPKLKVGGAAYLVVQKNLGSDSLIPWLDDALGEGFTASKYASSKGFRIIEVRHEI